MATWLDDFIAFKMTEDDTEESNAEAEDALDALRDELSSLQDEQLSLECNEPDDFGSTSYDRWEARKDLLDSQIMDLENEIAELEDLLDL